LAHEGDPLTDKCTRNRSLAARGDAFATLLVVCIAALVWLPRRSGPIDMRWDGAVYYILGTSLAEGRGYRLLNEPGAISAVQYPPLLPAVVAAHERALGTTDPTTVGRALRVTAFFMFLGYAAAVLRFLRGYLCVSFAVLGTLLSLFCFNAWFLSAALFPEIWFGVATLLFLGLMRRRPGSLTSAATYLAALASYALRTIGVAALFVWVLDSLVRRQFRQALVRAVLAAIPIVAWQGYIASVEHSAEYHRPAYEYQRAPYLFYNVSYVRNIALRDPYTPEKGPVRILRRVARNLIDVPLSLGEALTTSRGFHEMLLHGLLGDDPMIGPAIGWALFAGLSLLGGTLVAGGAALLVLRGTWLVPAYLTVYVGAMALTPFPEQYLRYLMPATAPIILCAVACLGRLNPTAPWVGMGGALLIELLVVGSIQRREYGPISYVDRQGERVSYNMFFYGDTERDFDQAVDYLQMHAAPGSIVAAGTPHWIYLRTGLTTVMPPFEKDVATAERLLEGVPVEYLIVGTDVIHTERYTVPVVTSFASRWTPVFSSGEGGWTIYRAARAAATHARASSAP
jgi:hypothetical protein